MKMSTVPASCDEDELRRSTRGLEADLAEAPVLRRARPAPGYCSGRGDPDDERPRAADRDSHGSVEGLVDAVPRRGFDAGVRETCGSTARPSPRRSSPGSWQERRIGSAVAICRSRAAAARAATGRTATRLPRLGRTRSDGSLRSYRCKAWDPPSLRLDPALELLSPYDEGLEFSSVEPPEAFLQLRAARRRRSSSSEGVVGRRLAARSAGGHVLAAPPSLTDRALRNRARSRRPERGPPRARRRT